MSKPRFLRDISLYTISGIANKLIGALLLPIVIRLLTPAEYAVIDLLTLTMAIGLECIILGTDYVIALYYHEETISTQRLIGTLFFTRLVVGVAIGLLGILINYFYGEHLFSSIDQYIFIIACLTLPFTAIINNWFMILRQQGQSLELVIISFSKVFLTALCTILFMQIMLPLQGYFVAFLCVDTLIASVLVMRYRKQIGRPELRLAKILFSKGLSYFPRSVYFIIMSLITRQLLLAWGTLEDVGLYAVAVRVSYTIWVFISASSSSWLAYSMSIAKEEKSLAIYAQYLEKYIIFVGLVTVGISLFSTEILMILTTPAYLPAAPIIGWQALSLMGIGAIVIVTTGLNIIKETAIIGKVTLFMACINIGVAIILIPTLGGIGAGLAAATDQLLTALIIYNIAQRKYPLPFRTSYIIFLVGLVITVLTISTFLPTSVSIHLFALKLAILGIYLVILYMAGAHRVLNLAHLIRLLYNKRMSIFKS